jgi:hypothetical protein
MGAQIGAGTEQNGVRLTWMPAQMHRWRMVVKTPSCDSRMSSTPGANKRMFILMLTAMLNVVVDMGITHLKSAHAVFQCLARRKFIDANKKIIAMGSLNSRSTKMECTLYENIQRVIRLSGGICWHELRCASSPFLRFLVNVENKGDVDEI